MEFVENLPAIFPSNFLHILKTHNDTLATQSKFPDPLTKALQPQYCHRFGLKQPGSCKTKLFFLYALNMVSHVLYFKASHQGLQSSLNIIKNSITSSNHIKI